MDSQKLIVNDWYSAQYEGGFSIIFQVIEVNNGDAIFCRKDGTIVDSIPDGYINILPHGALEPEYT